ncbi:MAG: GFA family protein [Rhizobiales bacterium]|nr:GFA family protein [Hyphomicrobiales bacterium]
MCQKASACHALALVSVRGCDVTWTRGAPAWFQSSNAARRGFCAGCGTPLAYDAPDGLALAVVTFDDPDAFPPTVAFGGEGKRAWADALCTLPERQTMDDVAAAPFLEGLISHQHPDRDTETWSGEPAGPA